MFLHGKLGLTNLTKVKVYEVHGSFSWEDFYLFRRKKHVFKFVRP